MSSARESEVLFATAPFCADALQEKNMDKEPLLEAGDQQSHPEETIQKSARSRSNLRCLQLLLCVLALAYAPLVLLYISLYWKVNQGTCNSYNPFPGECSINALLLYELTRLSLEALAKSPALQFEYRSFPVNVHENPFAGDPRPELDAAWHDLFEGKSRSVMTFTSESLLTM